MRYLYNICIKALFKGAKRLKQPKCSSTEEAINKMSYIQTIEYYSPLKGSSDTCHNINEPYIKGK